MDNDFLAPALCLACNRWTVTRFVAVPSGVQIACTACSTMAKFYFSKAETTLFLRGAKETAENHVQLMPKLGTLMSAGDALSPEQLDEA